MPTDSTLPPYEYHGLMAEAWDVLRGDTAGWTDRPFYLEAIARYGEPALDVGCGTGRLLLDYLAEGVAIDGVDNSPEMLAICRAKAAARGLEPTLYEQSMEALALPRRYGTILVPSSSLQLVLEPAEAAQAVARIHDHLLPGGAAVASIMTLWRPGAPLETETEEVAMRTTDGALFRRKTRSRFDPATSLEHTDTRYQRVVNGQVIAEERHVRSPATRSYTQEQARALFAQAGFASVTLLHEFTWEPARPEDTLFVVLAERPLDR